MKVNMQPKNVSGGPLGRRIQRAVVATALVGLPLAQIACGSDEKKSTAKSGTTTPGTTTTPGGTVTNPNTNLPSGGVTGTEPTTTNVVLTTDGTAAKPVKQTTYAIISYDGKSVLGYSYDYCGWLAKHATTDINNFKFPKDGEGAQFVIDISSTGTTPAASASYTINPTSNAGGVQNDPTLKGIVQADQTCQQVGRPAASGSIKWFSVSADKITGTIDASLAGWPDGTATTLKGGFVAEKCPSVAGTALTYAADSDSCGLSGYGGISYH